MMNNPNTLPGQPNRLIRGGTFFYLEVMRMLQVHVKSLFSGELNTMDIPTTYAQLERWLEGESIGVAMPGLEPEHVAFLVSGMAPGERRARFGDTMEACSKLVCRKRPRRPAR